MAALVGLSATLFIFIVDINNVSADAFDLTPESTPATGLLPAQTTVNPLPQNKEICAGLSFWDLSIESVLNCILLVIINFLNLILKAASVLFTTIIAPKNVYDVIGNQAVYQMWVKVRDVLNIAFILAILFSAFCTIFQIQKFNYKAMLLTIIIMALLVNFSFPIARVIIDIANVIMYYFAQALNLGIDPNASSSMYAQIANASGLGVLVDSVIAKGVKSDTFLLLALVVFLFIFTLTLLVISLLFVIRLIALAILVIFSPIGFVGPIVPVLSSQAGKWWDALFRYSFFGPIMVFMIYIAVQMMGAIVAAQPDMANAAQRITDAPGVVASIAFFAIPIVILWAGMAFAQTMSIQGAGAVVDGAQKFAKGAGKKFSGFNWTKKRYDAYKAERKTRADEKFKKNWGKSLGGGINKLQDKAQSILPPPVKVRGKEYDVFGSGAAQKRLDTRMTAANKEAIKNKSEGKDGVTTSNLVSNITANINTPPVTKDKKIDAAADLKQALSRGKEYETQVIQAIRSGSPQMNTFIANQIAAGNLPAGATGATHTNQVKALFYTEARKIIAIAEKA